MDLHVLMVSDDGYIPYMGTSLFSLLENNVGSFETIYIYIINNGILEDNKRKLIEQSRQYKNVVTSFVDFSQQFSKIHPIVEHGWNQAIYGRFFVDDVVNESVERVLYLDSDTIVEGSLKELLSIDMEDYCVAGVGDIMEKKQKEFFGIENYINSGVLLINMNKWREQNIQQKLIAFINTYPKKLLTPDQDAINAICGNMILRLPPKYNFGWMVTERRLKWDYEKADFPYSYQELFQTIKDSYREVVIFHYFGKTKPWRKGECTTEFERPFLNYYEKSIWWKKRGFKNWRKMLKYYFCEKPLYMLVRAARVFLGMECYDRMCGTFEKLRKS